MKVRSIFYGMLCMLALGVSFASCSDDDEEDSWNDEGSTVTLPRERMYILNEGTMGQNNSTLSFYAPNGDADFISDIYKLQNGAGLGDTGQDMLEYEGAIYVSVNGSNRLVKLNAAAVEQNSVEFKNDPDLQAGIRYIAAEDGYIYASFYGGVVAKINANTLQVEQKLTGLGANLEGIAIENGQLYVANSYGITPDGAYVYYKEVFVIDLRTFKLSTTLTVEENPNTLLEEDDRLYLISWNYNREQYVLQQIDPQQGNKVTELGYASHVAANNHLLYVVDSRVDYSNWPETSANNTFYTYDVNTGTANRTSFLKDAPKELNTAVIYMIEVNDDNGDIYIGTTGHSNQNGDIYRFRADGTFVEKFDCGGQNPKTLLFMD